MTENWRDSAACARVDPELFFPEPAGPRTGAKAKAICAHCPVKALCLDYALTLGGPGAWGVWGGTTDAERHRMREQAS